MQGYEEAGDLDKTIKDLNGDRKRELILYAYLKGEGARGSSLRPTAMWPQVYRLQNGSYVEASRDFPSFYDTEVLPRLEKDIATARESLAAHQSKPAPQDPLDEEWRLPERWLAVLLMEKDKILRVLGRDPSAGLAQAREWVKSPDPQLVGYATVVFDDIGGHAQELSAAKLTLQRLREHVPRKHL